MQYIENIFYINDAKLFDTYTHSHISTFMETYNKKNLGDKVIEQTLQKAVAPDGPLFKGLLKWQQEMKIAEDEFITSYSKFRKLSVRLTREQVINLLDSTYKDNNGELLVPLVSFAKTRETILKKDPSTTKKTDKAAEDVALRRYRGHLMEIGGLINDFFSSAGEYIATPSNKQGSQYELSKSRLRETAGIMARLPETLDRKALNRVYKRLVGALADLGWTFELVTQNLIKQKMETVLIGDTYKNRGTVIDLLITGLEGTEKKFGINVKSQEKKYDINRANNYEVPGLSDKYKYVLRNLGALHSYNINYEEYSEVGFRKLFNKYLIAEQKLAFLANLISALDTIRTGKDMNNFYSVLISYQGGFLWTTDVIDSIIKGLPDYLKSNRAASRFDSMGVIRANFKYYSTGAERHKLRVLFQDKKKILQKLENKENFRDENKKVITDVYKIFHQKIDFPFEDYSSLVSDINYTINLANAKKKSGGIQ